MRGKGGFAPRQASHLGITPAYAGKSKNISLEMIVILGSPPPMRGKGDKVLDFLREIGITPAYAGKSPAEPIIAPKC